MAADARISLPVRIVLQLLLTVGLVWFLNIFIDQYFYVYGGLPAYVIVGSLLTLMNLLARPLLSVLLLPFRLFFHLLTLIVSNALFLWLTQRIAAAFDPEIVILQITDGWVSWLLVACLLGLAHWLMRLVLR